MDDSKVPDIKVIQILQNPDRIKLCVDGQNYVYYTTAEEIRKFKTLLDHSKGRAIQYLKQHSTGSEKLHTRKDPQELKNEGLDIGATIKFEGGREATVVDINGNSISIVEHEGCLSRDITVSDVEEVVTSGNIGAYPLPFGVNDQGEVDDAPKDPSSRFAGSDRPYKKKKKRQDEAQGSGSINVGSMPNPTGVGETGETAQIMPEPGLRFKKNKKKKHEEVDTQHRYDMSAKKFDRSRKILDKMLRDDEKSSRKDEDPERLSVILNRKFPLGGEA